MTDGGAGLSPDKGGTMDRTTTAFVVDSTADLPPRLRADPNVRMVPLQVHFGDEVYRDWVDLEPDRFYEKLRQAEALPTTSQPSVGAFVQEYRQLREQYREVYSLHLSARLSGTYASAELASAEVDGVKVFDTKSASLGEGLLLDRLLAMLDRGTSAAEIEGLITSYPERQGFVFVVATLEYLQKGGRIGLASSLAGGLLNLKPVLTLTDGVVDAYAKARGEKKAMGIARDYFLERTRPGAPVAVAVAAADAPERAAAMLDLVRQTDRTIDHRFTADIGAVIGTYAGPGASALVFLQE